MPDKPRRGRSSPGPGPRRGPEKPSGRSGERPLGSWEERQARSAAILFFDSSPQGRCSGLSWSVPLGPVNRPDHGRRTASRLRYIVLFGLRNPILLVLRCALRDSEVYRLSGLDRNLANCCHVFVTRSVSEEGCSRPRLRFGLRLDWQGYDQGPSFPTPPRASFLPAAPLPTAHRQIGLKTSLETFCRLVTLNRSQQLRG